MISKKILLLVLILTAIDFYGYSQNYFNAGFQNGYKKANPISIVPIAPIPPIGKNTYEDGYGIGYAQGTADYNASQNLNTIPNNSRQNQNSGNQQNFIPKYEPYSPDINKMGEMLREKQRRQDSRTSPSTTYRPRYTYTPRIYPMPRWDSYSRIKRSHCSVSLSTSQNKIIFRTNDNILYEVWYKGEWLGEFTKYSNLKLENLNRGTYPFQVYSRKGNRIKKLRASDRWMLSTKSNWIIEITNERMGFN